MLKRVQRGQISAVRQAEIFARPLGLSLPLARGPLLVDVVGRALADGAGCHIARPAQPASLSWTRAHLVSLRLPLLQGALVTLLLLIFRERALWLLWLAAGLAAGGAVHPGQLWGGGGERGDETMCWAWRRGSTRAGACHTLQCRLVSPVSRLPWLNRASSSNSTLTLSAMLNFSLSGFFFWAGALSAGQAPGRQHRVVS